MRRGALISALLLATVAGLPGQTADSSRECAICHITWMSTFLDEQRDADLMAMPEGPMVNDEDMCFSCHDGSIDDARELVFLEHGHRTGITPDDGMTVPRELPLDSQGQILCATCHTAHRVDPHSADDRISFFLRMPNPNSELCMACHGENAEHAGARNHPIGVDVEGDWPPELTEALGMRGRDHDVTCQSCHAPHGSGLSDLLVMPVGQSELCTTCHSGHLAAGAGEWPPSHPVNLIPEEGTDIRRLVEHGGRLGEGGRVVCLSCHSTHRGVADGGVLVMDNRDDALCLLCHDEMTSLGHTPHALASTASELSNVQGRPAASAGSCSGCHLPHGAMGPMLWAREPEPGARGQAALCLSCHSGAHGDDIPSLTNVNHPRDIALPAGMGSGSLPLFGADLHPSTEGNLVCSTCHLIHDLREGAAISQGAEATLRLDNAGDQLCRQCHGAEWDTVSGGHHDLTAMQGQGLCSQCHTVHRGFGPHIWSRPLGAGDAPAEQLCGSCHGDPHMAEASPPSNHLHPVAGGSPAMGEGSVVPLFNRASAQRDAEGAMTCLSCHDAHHLPRDATEATRLSTRGESPLCRSCHSEAAALRESAHGRVALQMGDTCGACHRFIDEDGSGVRFGTAGAIAESGDALNSLCLTCHASGHRMLDAHPLAEALDLEVQPAHLPLFDATGERSDEGHMTCATCHEPHGFHAEGDLLRPAEGDDPALCTDCHRAQRSVAGTDHDLRITAPGTENQWGQRAEDGTVCSACHTAHPREPMPLLWGGPLGEGADFVSRTCTGCHREGGAARPVPHATPRHPETAVAFWLEGGASGDGAITCATCHDAHHWGAEPPGVDSEGDLLTSFLRRGVAAQICSQCHGREAMVRHLLFHRGQRWGQSALVPRETDQ
ncbi:cytochrome c3 family protein [Candidatus Sumerlaeota bacterium]|nr:cytochrome c3 family protein [Candidatus Sumerlaeota bacterium]